MTKIAHYSVSYLMKVLVDFTAGSTSWLQTKCRPKNKWLGILCLLVSRLVKVQFTFSFLNPYAKECQIPYALFFSKNVPDIDTYQLSRSNLSITQKVCNDNRVYFKSTEWKEKFSRC